MIPVGDDGRRRRFPVITAALIAVNALVFFYELSLGQGAALERFFHAWGAVPREYALGRDLAPTIDAPYWTTLVTSMFLHGGWAHLLGNMLFLWVFGDNVEDSLGRGKFVLFYVVTGIAGGLLQIVMNTQSMIPSVGASGAISGVLGAYIVMFPRNRIRVLMGFGIIAIPAVMAIGLWFLMQLIAGAGTLGPRTAETGGVAYLAHVGGFVAGAVLAL